ncbi:MAG: helix-turn-helix transcriptional regulator [Tissierellia bacterium]|nr:helix-turn-helix transcriptional regulator [Tissierellia bacterium]
MKVKNRIREIRESLGISQIDAAAQLNVSRQTMSAIENMKYNPSLELTLKIAQLFSMPVEEIFELIKEDN